MSQTHAAVNPKSFLAGWPAAITAFLDAAAGVVKGFLTEARSVGRLPPGRLRRTARACLDVQWLEPRLVLTPFTMNSPIGLEPLVSDIPPAGGIVLDLVGTGRGRIEAEVAPSQLYSGTAKCGTPASYRGNPVTLGIQTDLSPTAREPGRGACRRGRADHDDPGRNRPRGTRAERQLPFA